MKHATFSSIPVVPVSVRKKQSTPSQQNKEWTKNRRKLRKEKRELSRGYSS